jgi:hypothetical protein
LAIWIFGDLDFRGTTARIAERTTVPSCQRCSQSNVPADSAHSAVTSKTWNDVQSCALLPNTSGRE